MLLGDVRIDPVIDGEGRFDPTLAYKATPRERWDEHEGLLDADGMLPFVFAGFLIRTGDRTVLVDLGYGPKAVVGIQCGSFLTSLAALDVTPEDVTDVLFTHLHGDHIGWAHVGGEATFPAAAYRCAAADLRHFLVDHRGEEADILDPVASRFETWDTSGPLLPGVDVQLAPGHTPGSSLIVASSGTERAILLGDVVHCTVELVDDEWETFADVDPEMALRTRAALNRELEGDGSLVAGAHFPGASFGRLVRAQGRRRWVL